MYNTNYVLSLSKAPKVLCRRGAGYAAGRMLSYYRSIFDNVNLIIINGREDIHQRCVDDNFSGIDETCLADVAMLAVVVLAITFGMAVPRKDRTAYVRVE